MMTPTQKMIKYNVYAVSSIASFFESSDLYHFKVGYSERNERQNKHVIIVVVE